MPKKAKELSEVSIRRLTHTVATGEKNSELAGKPYKAVYAVGGVTAYIYSVFLQRALRRLERDSGYIEPL